MVVYLYGIFSEFFHIRSQDSNPGVPGSPSVPLLSATQWRIAALKVSLPFLEEHELKWSLLPRVPWSGELRRSWGLPPFRKPEFTIVVCYSYSENPLLRNLLAFI